MRVIDFAEKKRLHDARRGRLVSGRLRFVLLDDGSLEIQELNQNDAVIREWEAKRETAESLIDRLAIKLRRIKTEEWRKANPPPPPPPPPKWTRCWSFPESRVTRQRSDGAVLSIHGRRNRVRCLRRDGHDGEHHNREQERWATSLEAKAAT